MKYLIIYAHPNKKGNNGLILKEVTKNVEDYEIIDLYNVNYKPVLEEKELYTQGNKFLSKQTIAFQKKISESDKLIIIYPVWWNNVPAILKGFFEKVITPGFAFKYVTYFGKLPVPVGLLKGKKACVFITTNSPKWVYNIIQNKRASKTIQKDMLGFCGIKSKVFHLGNALHPYENKDRIKKLVSKGLHWLN